MLKDEALFTKPWKFSKSLVKVVNTTYTLKIFWTSFHKMFLKELHLKFEELGEGFIWNRLNPVDSKGSG